MIKIKLCLLFVILNMLVINNVYAVTYNAQYWKDINVNTPGGTETPSILDDSMREFKRVESYDSTIVTKTADYTLTGSETVCLGSGTIQITLPSASTVAGSSLTKSYTIKNTGTSGTVTVSGTIDGVGTRTLSKNDTLLVFSDGSNWYEQRAMAGSIVGYISLGTQTVGTIGLGTQTSGTLSLGTQTNGTISLGTQTSGTLNLTGNTSGNISFATQTSGLVSLGTQTNSTLNLTTQTNSTIGLATQTSGTLGLSTQTSGFLSLGTQTNGAIGLATQTSGLLSLGTQTNSSVSLGTQTNNLLSLGTQTNGILNLTGNTSGDISFGTQTSGLLSLGTQTLGTIGLATQTSGLLSLGTQTNGVVSLGTQTNGSLNVSVGTITTLTGSTGTLTGAMGALAFYANGALMPATALTEWRADGKVGTGSQRIAAGGGMVITATYNDNGIGTITYATSGTASAGGWNDTGDTVLQETSTNIIRIDNISIYAGTATLSEATITRGTSTNYTITTGSITNSVSSIGTVTTLYSTTGNITNAVITTGTITTLTGVTGTLTGGFRAATFYGDGSQLAGIDTAGTNTFSVVQFVGTTTAITGTSSNGRLYTLTDSLNSTVTASAYMLLLNCNNPGTTTFTDSSNKNRTVTRSGDTIGTATNAIYGTGCAYLDGTGDDLYHADSPDWDVNNNPFRIRFSVYPETTQNDMYLSQYDTADIANSMCQINQYSVSNKVDAYFGQAGSWHNTLSTATCAVGTWTTVEIGRRPRVGTTTNEIYIAINGSLDTTNIISGTINNSTITLSWGRNQASGGQPYQGYMDNMSFEKGTYSVHPIYAMPTYTDPGTVTVAYLTSIYSYIPPGTTTSVVTIISYGTDTSQSPKLLIGTNTAFSTTTAYLVQAIQGGGGYLGDRFGQYCFGAIKSIAEEGTKVQAQCYADVMQVKIVKQSPIIRVVSDIEVEIAAKEEYLKEDYSLWRKSKEALDTYKIFATQTSGFTIDEKKLNKDFKALRTSEWNVGLPDKNDRIKKKKYDLEADKEMLSTSIITDNPSTPESFKTKTDPLIWDAGNTMGNLIGAFQELARKVEALEAKP